MSQSLWVGLEICNHENNADLKLCIFGEPFFFSERCLCSLEKVSAPTITTRAQYYNFCYLRQELFMLFRCNEMLLDICVLYVHHSEKHNCISHCNYVTHKRENSQQRKKICAIYHLNSSLWELLVIKITKGGANLEFRISQTSRLGLERI